MIRLDSVEKIFHPGRPNAFRALRGIDLVLPDHTLNVFTGPSGSGKTTLLAVIGLMLRPTSGALFMNGEKVSGLPERFAARFRSRTVGFLFQRHHLMAGLSVLENILIPAYPSGAPRRTLLIRAEALMDLFRIAHLASRKPSDLSAGERLRAALARALMNDPPVIIADEPTAHLDTPLAEEFMALAGRLKSEGKTLVMASHDARVYGSPWVDRIIRLEDGRIADERPAL